MIFPIFYRKRLESIHDLILRPGGHGGIHKDACDDLAEWNFDLRAAARAKNWITIWLWLTYQQKITIFNR